MGTINSDKSWKAYGKKNAYFGVLTHDEYLDENLSIENKKKFFATGQKHVEHTLKLISQKLDTNFSPKNALDFGCGTGRISLAFARKGITTTGIDVSSDMIEEAKSNAIEQQILNVNFYISDDQLASIKGREFDLINSYIVLQHINIERGLNIFKLLLNSLSKNGVGVVQFTYRSNKPKTVKIANYFRYRIPLVNVIMNVLKGNSARQPLMQMNAYNLNTIYAVLQEHGIQNTYQELEKHGDFWGVTIYFQN